MQLAITLTNAEEAESVYDIGKVRDTTFTTAEEAATNTVRKALIRYGMPSSIAGMIAEQLTDEAVSDGLAVDVMGLAAVSLERVRDDVDWNDDEGDPYSRSYPACNGCGSPGRDTCVCEVGTLTYAAWELGMFPAEPTPPTAPMPARWRPRPPEPCGAYGTRTMPAHALDAHLKRYAQSRGERAA